MGSDENVGSSGGKATPPAVLRPPAQSGSKRSLEVDSEAAGTEPLRAVRLKWVAQRLPEAHGVVPNDVRLVLDSFELVQGSDPSSRAELTSGTSPQACVAAASLLASLLQVPASAILTAEFPLVRELQHVLQPLSPAISNI